MSETSPAENQKITSTSCSHSFFLAHKVNSDCVFWPWRGNKFEILVKHQVKFMNQLATFASYLYSVTILARIILITSNFKEFCNSSNECDKEEC